MIDSHQDELFAEAKPSFGPKVLAGVAALVITAIVFAGYVLLRKRHAQNTGSLKNDAQAVTAEPREAPKALILVDDALIQGSKTIVGGTVRNTSPERLEGLSVELELKRRRDGAAEKKLVTLEPSDLESQQEGRYSLQLRAQDYSSARVVGIKAGANFSPVPYNVAQGQKRPPERLESKTITVDKQSSKRGEFLNSPDKPARVP
jgi:hypothetical protein